MKRYTPIITALAASALMLAGANVYAADSGEQAEMAAVVKAQVSPVKAVQIAENGGGRAYGYGMEVQPKGHWYEVEVLRGNAPLQLRIDPTTGKLLGSSKATGEDLQGAHALEQSKLTLASAISQAERTGNGTALEANAAGSGANAHVTVDVVHHGKLEHYRVSMHNGQIHAQETGAEENETG